MVGKNEAFEMNAIKKIKLALGGTLVAFIGILWAFGGFIGAIIAATRDDLLSVVLAIFIPGYGAIYTVIAIFRALF